MAFDSGSVSFQACRILDDLPEDYLERFKLNAAQPLDYVKDEPQLGWVSGRHLLETRIDDETAFMGGYLHLFLRSSQRKVPSSLLQAECKMEELVVLRAEEKTALSRKRKAEIKNDIIERLLPTMPPSISGTAFVLDTASSILYVGASSLAKIEAFLNYFNESIGIDPIPLIPETLVQEQLEVHVSELPLLNFAPDKVDESASGTLNFDFLTWLLFLYETRDGQIPSSKYKDFYFMIDGPMVFVSEDDGAFEFAVRKGTPTLSPEVQTALTIGKKLKQAKFTFGRGDDTWTFTFDADNFCFKSMKLPDGEALEEHSKFEERIHLIHEINGLFMALFLELTSQLKDPVTFAKLQKEIKDWVKNRAYIKG